jgi:hypothetical protein
MKMFSLCQKYNKPLYIICGINKLSPDEMSALSLQHPLCEVYDLVSRFGIERSLKETASCVKEMVEKEIIQSIKNL